MSRIELLVDLVSERRHRLYALAGLVVFFFQAEDGIRDVAVTGVQTCALPISRCRFRREPGTSWPSSSVLCLRTRSPPPWRPGSSRERGVDGCSFEGLPRSEERRVGKECRSRWSPYH